MLVEIVGSTHSVTHRSGMALRTHPEIVSSPPEVSVETTLPSARPELSVEKEAAAWEAECLTGMPSEALLTAEGGKRRKGKTESGTAGIGQTAAGAASTPLRATECKKRKRKDLEGQEDATAAMGSASTGARGDSAQQAEDLLCKHVLVEARCKALLKTSEMTIDREAMRTLGEKVLKLIDGARDRAQRNKRKTVLAKDF